MFLRLVFVDEDLVEDWRCCCSCCLMFELLNDGFKEGAILITLYIYWKLQHSIRQSSLSAIQQPTKP